MPEEKERNSYKQETVKNPSRQETAENIKEKKGRRRTPGKDFAFFLFSDQTLFSSSSLKVSQEKRRKKVGKKKAND